MGCSFSFGSQSRYEDLAAAPVVLHVYDLTPMNNYLYYIGLGIFHSGIEVHGLEYAFGAHEYPTSGVFEVEPKSCPGFVYRCSITLGHTDVPPLEFQATMEQWASDYNGDTYHLIYKNCNHFTNDVCLKLTGRPTPGWVNRLAHLASFCSCLLPESLQIPVVRQRPEYHSFSDSEAISIIPAHEPTGSDTDRDKCLPRPSIRDITFVKEAPW